MDVREPDERTESLANAAPTTPRKHTENEHVTNIQTNGERNCIHHDVRGAKESTQFAEYPHNPCNNYRVDVLCSGLTVFGQLLRKTVAYTMRGSVLRVTCAFHCYEIVPTLSFGMCVGSVTAIRAVNVCGEIRAPNASESTSIANVAAYANTAWTGRSNLDAQNAANRLNNNSPIQGRKDAEKIINRTACRSKCCCCLTGPLESSQELKCGNHNHRESLVDMNCVTPGPNKFQCKHNIDPGSSPKTVFEELR